MSTRVFHRLDQGKEGREPQGMLWVGGSLRGCCGGRGPLEMGIVLCGYILACVCVCYVYTCLSCMCQVVYNSMSASECVYVVCVCGVCMCVCVCVCVDQP